MNKSTQPTGRKLGFNTYKPYAQLLITVLFVYYQKPYEKDNLEFEIILETDPRQGNPQLKIQRATLATLARAITTSPRSVLFAHQQPILKSFQNLSPETQQNTVRNALHCLFQLNLAYDQRNNGKRNAQWHFIIPLCYGSLHNNYQKLNIDELMNQWDECYKAKKGVLHTPYSVRFNPTTIAGLTCLLNADKKIPTLNTGLIDISDRFCTLFKSKLPKEYYEEIIRYVKTFPPHLAGYANEEMNILQRAIPSIHDTLSQPFPIKRHDAVAIALSLGKLLIVKTQFDLAEAFISEGLQWIQQTPTSIQSKKHLSDMYMCQNALLNHYQAVIYQERGDYQKAADLYEVAIQMYTAAHQIDSCEAANSYHNLGLLYLDLQQTSQASDNLQRAFKIRKQNAVNQLDYAGSLNGIAKLFSQKGYYKRAEILYLAAIRNVLVTQDAKHPFLLDSYTGLVNLYVRQSESMPTAKRLTYLQKAAIYVQKIHDCLPSLREPSPIKKAVIDVSIAGLYFVQALHEQTNGDTEKAKTLYHQCEVVYLAAIHQVKQFNIAHPMLVALSKNLVIIQTMRMNISLPRSM